MTSRINISSHFDSGNIKVIAAESASDIQLEIHKDSHSDFYQWFHFRLQSDVGSEHIMRITNAAGAAYVEGWDDYQAVASYDRINWFRVETDYIDGQLVIRHTLEQNSVFFAYFAPYSYERHLDLLQSIQLSPICRLEHLGQTLQGRDMTVAVIGEPTEQKTAVWIIARQHPGEAMAQWFSEGLLERLLDEDDAVSKKLLESCVFYIVPNMNPDGGALGNLRCNSEGANLNREWLEPTMSKSPEVYLVREKMLQTGVDVFLDIHGDEAIPQNFLAGCEGIPSYGSDLKEKQEYFKTSFLKSSPDFQVTEGYPADEPGQADLSMATTWVAEQFHCLSYTLEMPFKDNNDLPDDTFGWSAERSCRFGEAILLPILDTVTHF